MKATGNRSAFMGALRLLVVLTAIWLLTAFAVDFGYSGLSFVLTRYSDLAAFLALPLSGTIWVYAKAPWVLVSLVVLGSAGAATFVCGTKHRYKALCLALISFCFLGYISSGYRPIVIWGTEPITPWSFK